MRILFLTCDYPSAFEPRKGPFNAALVRALREVGHDVRVVSPISWITRLRDVARRGDTSDASVARPTYFYPPKLLREHYGSFYWLSVRRAVKRLIAEQTPDVVLAYWAHPDGAAAVRVSQSCGAMSAIIVGGSDVLSITRKAARRECVRSALTAADVVFTVNQHLRNATIALGVDPARAVVWSQGVDKEIFHPGDRAVARAKLGVPLDRRAMVWAGRFVHVKGIEVLLDAIARHRAMDAHAYLIGDGPLRTALEARVRELRIENDVTFVGGCSPQQLAGWYRASDLVVLPSRSEGLPNVLRETIACGRRFVASNVGGISEIARNGIDLLVPANDVEGLYKGIARSFALSDPEPAANSLPTWRDAARSLVSTLQQICHPGRYSAKDLASSERGDLSQSPAQDDSALVPIAGGGA